MQFKSAKLHFQSFIYRILLVIIATIYGEVTRLLTNFAKNNKHEVCF
jgi:hypothetical protein